MGRSYRDAGVLSSDEIGALRPMLKVLRRTFDYPSRGKPVTGFGLYAAVLDLGNNMGLAISTDGVGTKLLVAEEMQKFDTIGIDCVAMNANDIICVGAEPIAMVDYVAIASAEGDQLLQLAEGLRRGAELAGISIPGGETAQIPELLHKSPNNEAFDIAGTCVGLVDMDRIISGKRIAAGNALIGYASSGVHSNGLTLARHVLTRDAGWTLDSHVEDFGRTVGEELLEPTRMYVKLAMDLLATTDVRGLAHITGDGLLNIRRFEADMGFEIDALPEANAVFQVIQRMGNVALAEMYRVFNMGIGFCAVVPEGDVENALAAGKREGFDCWRIGTATPSDEHVLRLAQHGLESKDEKFV